MNYNYGIIRCELNKVLKARGKNKKYLVEKGISYKEMLDLENFQGNLETVLKLCWALNCQPAQIIKWTPPELMQDYINQKEFEKWLKQKKKEGVDISRYQSVSDEEIKVMLETIKNQ